MLIRKAMEALSATRPIFHSEADFQHAFAWMVHTLDPEATVRLEVPFHSGDARRYLDVVIKSREVSAAVELKYKTRMLLAEAKNEAFFLEDQSAQDLGRYDFFKDIQRLEESAKAAPGRSGAAVFLTNDSAYWKPPGRSTSGLRPVRND